MLKKRSIKPEKSKNNRNNQVLLFLTMFVIMVGFGVIMPILPYYAENMGATATHLGLLTSMYAGLQFIFAPVWGRISDRIGRKPVMLIGLFGFTLTFTGFGLSTHLWMLFLARGISGFVTSATLPSVMAYIADITDNENRGNGMSLLGSAMGLGTIFGPVIGGFLGEFGPGVPFYFSAILALGVAFFALKFLPESLSRENRQTAAIAQKQKYNFFNVFRMLGAPIGFLFILALLSSFGMAHMDSTSALFYEYKIGAGGTELGIIYMVMGAVSFLAQFFLVGKSIRKWGEQKTFTFSLMGVALAFLLFSIITDMSTAILVVIIMGFASSFFRPALNTLVSNRTPDSEQGVNMGVVNSYYSLGRMIGPITGGVIFDKIGIHMPFYFAACIIIITLVLAVFLFNRKNLPCVQGIVDAAGD